MDEHLESNRKLWNEKVNIHYRSDYYDVEGFKAGEESLYPIEIEELAGEVAGKTMLHLQCHFGMDTMSWARRGAVATGVDFAEEAVEQARALSDELGLDCKFVHSNIYELPKKLEGQFDIVFTSYGVLPWLPDMMGWAKVAAHFLKPGGTFYIVEHHPAGHMLDDWKQEEPEMRLRYSYFHTEEPMVFEAEGSYADPDARFSVPEVYEWQHSLGDILTALAEAGLRIEYLHEFDYSTYLQTPYMEKRGRLYFLPEGMPRIPLMFSLRARKE